MSVLVTTIDGYHIFTSSGKHLTSLEGHRIESFTPGPGGTWFAIVDAQEIWQHGADGEWTPLVKTGTDLTALASAGSTVFAGTVDARVLRVVEGAVTPLPAFDTVPGRETWHRVGSPLQVRSMTTTADAGALLVNVHVGGIPRSVDGGETFAPTLDVDDDVHQVLAHPTRPEVVVAAASVGLCRSTDGGATWTSTTDGMDGAVGRLPRVGRRRSRRESDGWAARLPLGEHRHPMHHERRHRRGPGRRRRRRLAVREWV